MKKKKMYTELSYIIGILILEPGVALMTKSDFGISMLGAPPYLLHLKISQYFPFFSFGMASYTLQVLILILLTVVCRRPRPAYLFAFVTAFICGNVLDINMAIVSHLPDGAFLSHVYFISGTLLCSLGIAFELHSYISPEVPELFVKEFSAVYKKDLVKVKTSYDVISCAAGIVLSFCFFGMWNFVAIKWGTVICALVNGYLIGAFGKMIERIFDFKDRFDIRHLFE